MFSGITIFLPPVGTRLSSHIVGSFQYFVVTVDSDTSFTIILELFLNIISPITLGSVFKCKITPSSSVINLPVSGMFN